MYGYCRVYLLLGIVLSSTAAHTFRTTTQNDTIDYFTEFETGNDSLEISSKNTSCCDRIGNSKRCDNNESYSELDCCRTEQSDHEICRTEQGTVVANDDENDMAQLNCAETCCDDNETISYPECCQVDTLEHSDIKKCSTEREHIHTNDTLDTGNNTVQCKCSESPPKTSSATMEHGLVLVNDSGNATAQCNCSREHTTTLSASLDTGLVSFSTYQYISNIIPRFIIPVLVVGLICNVVSICVYVHPTMRTTANTYLALIACVDIIFVICSLIIESVKSAYGPSAINTHMFLEITKYCGNYTASCCRRLVFCLTLLVTFERLFAVAFPLKVKLFRLLKSPRTLITSLTVIIFGFHSFAILKLMTVSQSQGNVTKHRMVLSDLFKRNRDVFKMLSMSGSVIFVFIPLLGVLVCNLLTGVYLRVRVRFRRSLNKTLQRRLYESERQTTVTIIVSSFIYVILNLPLNVNSLIANIVTHYGVGGREHYLFLLIHQIGYFCQHLGTITNFISYLLLSSRFRRVIYYACYYPRLRLNHRASPNSVSFSTNFVSRRMTLELRTVAAETHLSIPDSVMSASAHTLQTDME